MKSRHSKVCLMKIVCKSAGSRGNVALVTRGSFCLFCRNEMANQAPQERTFQYQRSLPSLPVPSLETTLAKYLDAGAIVGFTMLGYVSTASRDARKMVGNESWLKSIFCALNDEGGKKIIGGGDKRGEVVEPGTTTVFSQEGAVLQITSDVVPE